MSKVMAFFYYCDNFKAAKHKPQTVEADTVLVHSPAKGYTVELDICDDCLGKLTLPQINDLADALGRDIPEPHMDTSLLCPFGCNKGQPYKSQNRLIRHLTTKHPEYEQEG